MAAISAEAFLEPPGDQVLVQAETVLADEFESLFCGNETGVFLFQPTISGEEVENQGQFIFGGLFGNTLCRSEGVGANLVAATVQQVAVVDLEFSGHAQGENFANVPVDQVLVKGVGALYCRRIFERHAENVYEVCEAVVYGSAGRRTAPQYIFAAHFEQEVLQVAALAYGNCQAKFVKGQASRCTVVN